MPIGKPVKASPGDAFGYITSGWPITTICSSGRHVAVVRVR
jgi:hypothetical protein